MCETWKGLEEIIITTADKKLEKLGIWFDVECECAMGAIHNDAAKEPHL